MSVEKSISAEKALEWLIEGNNDYIFSERNHHGNISHELRMHTHHHGQNPFAIIVTCSDSRVIPENIFMKGIGELFVIRIAGNILGRYGMGSIEYAVEHLGCKLVLVMGHTKCGAIQAALHGAHDGFVGTIIDEIQKNIGSAKNVLFATRRNVYATIKKLEDESKIIQEYKEKGLKVVGSIYHTSTGEVEIFE